MAATKKRGVELLQIGMIDTRNESILNLLKDNGYYLEKRRLEKFDREHYIIFAEVED